jgi:hypothetical protein
MEGNAIVGINAGGPPRHLLGLLDKAGAMRIRRTTTTASHESGPQHQLRLVLRVVLVILLLTAAFILVNALVGSTGNTRVG